MRIMVKDDVRDDVICLHDVTCLRATEPIICDARGPY